MIVEIDTDKLDAVAKDLREIATKHKLSVMELGQAVIAVCSHQYFKTKCLNINQWITLASMREGK